MAPQSETPTVKVCEDRLRLEAPSRRKIGDFNGDGCGDDEEADTSGSHFSLVISGTSFSVSQVGSSTSFAEFMAQATKAAKQLGFDQGGAKVFAG